MFKVLLGDIRNGRLARLPYLGYSLLLVALAVIFGLAIVLAIGAGEHILGGDLEQTQARLREWFTVPLIVVVGLAGLLLTFAAANTTAKRIRDAGLPGWWLVLAIMVVTGVVSGATSPEAGSGLHSLIWIVLLLIPTNAFAR